jgi:hypothetical protein
MKSLKEFKISIEEGVMYGSDYRLSPSGRKVRARRIHVGDTNPNMLDLDDDGKDDDSELDKDFKKIYPNAVKEEVEELDEQLKSDPPFVLVLKRKAFRMYPNGMKIALYYNDKLKKYFSVPYSFEQNVNSPIQAEEVESLEEAKQVMDHIHDIVREKQAKRVKFANGKSTMIDGYTASAIKQVHDAVSDENKAKIRHMVHQSPEHLGKVASFAFSKVK